MEIKDEDIKDIKSQIINENLKEGEYIILIYEKHHRWSKVRFAYKNFDDFEKKVQNDYKKHPFDEDNGIYLEWRTFD